MNYGRKWIDFGILWKKMENVEENGVFFTQIKVNKLNDGMLQYVPFNNGVVMCTLR